jgi:hypothetical protein
LAAVSSLLEWLTNKTAIGRPSRPRAQVDLL